VDCVGNCDLRRSRCCLKRRHAFWAVWGTTSIAGKPPRSHGVAFCERHLAREQSPFSTDDASGVRRKQFNAAQPTTSTGFIADIQKMLALTGCAGREMRESTARPDQKSRRRAIGHSPNCLRRIDFGSTALRVSAHSFSPLNSRTSVVERSLITTAVAARPPMTQQTFWRSLLIRRHHHGHHDGLHQDEHPPSAAVFPFLAAPDPNGVNH